MPGCRQLQLEEKEREDEIRMKALEERFTHLEQLITEEVLSDPSLLKA